MIRGSRTSSRFWEDVHGGDGFPPLDYELCQKDGERREGQIHMNGFVRGEAIRNYLSIAGARHLTGDGIR